MCVNFECHDTQLHCTEMHFDNFLSDAISKGTSINDVFSIFGFLDPPIAPVLALKLPQNSFFDTPLPPPQRKRCLCIVPKMKDFYEADILH